MAQFMYSYEFITLKYFSSPPPKKKFNYSCAYTSVKQMLPEISKFVKLELFFLPEIVSTQKIINEYQC